MRDMFHKGLLWLLLLGSFWLSGQPVWASGGVVKRKIVFEPQDFDLNVRMTGSSRFPGDRGLPIMFSWRTCPASDADCVADPFDSGSVTTTDDFITSRITLDNNTRNPRTLNLLICADRSALNPKLTPSDITEFFRPIGGGPPIMNPITAEAPSILRSRLPGCRR